MIYQLKDWRFDADRQVLSMDNTEARLEPLQSELLRYFCDNPQRIITRDELIESVWQGHIVTENAVNRVIAKLRKSLKDQVKNPRFIVTYPKKGYKFIVSVDSNVELPIIKPKKTSMNLIMAVSVVLCSVIAALTFFYENDADYFYKAKALTRGGGQEYEAKISPNGSYLSYSAFESGVYHLYLKDLTTGETKRISDGLGNAGSSDWSADGGKLIYLYTHKDRCELRLMTLTNSQVLEEKIIHNCPSGSYGSVTFTHDTDHIIYAERSSQGAPYYIYRLNINDFSQTQLNQPVAYKAGNSQFDLHPTEDKLLISSPDEQQWLGFYVLDLTTDELTFLFKKDEHLCCAIWNHNGDKIITMGLHPANSLIEISMDGKNIKTLYETTHQVGPPVRVTHNETYLYSGGQFDYDIKSYHVDSKTHEFAVDSSVTDEFPAISHSGEQLAFLSRRSGHSQVWIKDLKNSQLSMLSQFDNHDKHFDIKWSPDDKYIAVLSSNGIHVIDTLNDDKKSLKLSQQEIRGMSWFDNNQLAFSLKKNQLWRVHHYDINKDTIRAMHEQWAYINYDNEGENHGFIDHQQQLFIGNRLIDQVSNQRWLFQNRFDFEQQQGKLYYYDKDAKDAFGLYVMDLESNLVERLYDSTCSGMTISMDKVFYCYLSNTSADIFQLFQSNL